MTISQDICRRMDVNEHIERLLNQSKLLTIAQKEKLKDEIVLYVNQLLLHDFNKLVQVLYTVDVSEKKLKELLQKNPATDAAIIIADLLIERQDEKVKTKRSFKANDNIPDDEKW